MDDGTTTPCDTLDLRGLKCPLPVLHARRLVASSNNLGDARSLATHPATTTHMRIGPDARARLGIGDGVIRLSVGLEDPADLIEDLEFAVGCLDGHGDTERAAE